jgi:acetyl-CoA hydrolase
VNNVNEGLAETTPRPGDGGRERPGHYPPRPVLPVTLDVSAPTGWPSAYRSILSTVEDALRVVRSGNRVYIGGGCGEPLLLARGLVERAPELREVEVIHVMTAGHADYAAPELAQSFRPNALFIGPNVRQAIREGRADFTPVFLSDIPALFRDGTLPLDVALISVSPPDSHGYCSFGIEVGTTKPAADYARVVIAEVNPHMPRTWGNSFIHLSQIDYCVPVDYPLTELHQHTPSPLYSQIGRHIAELIDHGDTLQLGIGAIPDAVLQFLIAKRDLGIHSELVSDGIIDLVEKGVITGLRKTFLPGKILAGFMLGSQRLFRFVHDNPIIEMRPTDFVNDVFNISRNDNMVAINSALQVDLTGQVCADSIGTQFYSGVGGQADFIRGAARSNGGKPIIALPSTAKDGTISRIVSTLDPGAGVTTSRNDVHYVVTEFGIASLHGKSVRQRAQELIAIAHPDFRDKLRAEAQARLLL